MQLPSCYEWLWILASGAVLFVIPVWKICTKAGYPGQLSLLGLVPIANIVLLYYLAFAEWPSQRKVTEPEQDSGAKPSAE
jgi:hypothetical protein